MTVNQYNVIKMAKAIEYLDKFDIILNDASEERKAKAKEARDKMKILEKGIIATFSYPRDKEAFDKAMEIVNSIPKI